MLIDAPCSGLGVMRSKPDIKYRKTDADVTALAAIQAEILQAAAPLLKKDGLLVYSTCTIDKRENEQVVAAFLSSHPEFEIDPSLFEALPDYLRQTSGISAYGLQLFPSNGETDGFFLSKMIKKT
ncbi:hypothetical protein P5G51_011485 [Virgibacillus sp. 179-BFC.A HS]|uniref:SAM-dependent MTase RsmB/NOP-type domain-containing protein n=1 Tax=Tigheibacillus jepli TaxID=3035914 RepID=A0ABU5CJ97_9BACI|nr:hypothetical protein [Virgibacillus sp. 179-BFC.A HS]MDY0405927.1 hypothetical protein [Virgibacillus sp. 179-BFC.A HS]